MNYNLSELLKNPEVRALINEPNNAGDTPLHEAIVSLKTAKSAQAIYILFNAGADPNAPDGQGRTPLELLLSVMNSVGNERAQMVYGFGFHSYQEKSQFFQRFQTSAKALIERGALIPEDIRGPITELIFGEKAIDLVGRENLENILAGCYD